MRRNLDDAASIAQYYIKRAHNDGAFTPKGEPNAMSGSYSSSS